jgi:hypothetical protein
MGFMLNLTQNRSFLTSEYGIYAKFDPKSVIFDHFKGIYRENDPNLTIFEGPKSILGPKHPGNDPKFDPKLTLFGGPEIGLPMTYREMTQNRPRN